MDKDQLAKECVHRMSGGSRQQGLASVPAIQRDDLDPRKGVGRPRCPGSIDGIRPVQAWVHRGERRRASRATRHSHPPPGSEGRREGSGMIEETEGYRENKGKGNLEDRA